MAGARASLTSHQKNLIGRNNSRGLSLSCGRYQGRSGERRRDGGPVPRLIDIHEGSRWRTGARLRADVRGQDHMQRRHPAGAALHQGSPGKRQDNRGRIHRGRPRDQRLPAVRKAVGAHRRTGCADGHRPDEPMEVLRKGDPVVLQPGHPVQRLRGKATRPAHRTLAGRRPDGGERVSTDNLFILWQ